MAPPLRVLITADAVGGVWTHVHTLVEALGPEVDYTVAVLGPAAPPPLPEHLRRRVHHHTGRLEWMEAPWDDVGKAGTWLLALAARVRPDVVHLNGYTHAALPFGVPVLVGAHSCVCSWWRAVHGTAAPASWDTYRRQVRAGLHAASLVVAPSAAMLRMLEAEHGRLARRTVIHNGAAWRRGRSRPENRIISVGRFWDEAKNLSVLEHIAADLSWPVTVIGPLDAPAGSPAPAPRAVEALGSLPPAQVRQWLQRSRIYAHPARYEPFGLSILEAAQAGCALVLADLPSLREIWGTAALYVPPDDPEGWRVTLQALAASPARLDALSAAARRAARRCSARTMARAYFRCYHQLAGRRATATRRPVLTWGLQPGAAS